MSTPPRLVALPPATEAHAGEALADRDDDALMLLGSAGRADAFAALVDRYMKRLTNLCAKLLCDLRGGEEIAQEAWLRVWVARGSYRPGTRFDVFLFTVARNLCRNHLRDRGRRSRWISPAAIDDDAARSDAPSHLDALIERERQRRVHEAMARLETPLREVLLFRFSEGLEYADIARIIERTESAVRSRVHVAIGKLREELDKGGQ